MEEKEFSEKENLALISGRISEAKNHYYENGFNLFIWFFTSVICVTHAYKDIILRKGFYKNIAIQHDGI